MSLRFLSTIFDPDANSVLLRAHLCTAVDSTRAPDAGAWGPPVLRGECEEVFVFELSGTHELHTINTTY